MRSILLNIVLLVENVWLERDGRREEKRVVLYMFPLRSIGSSTKLPIGWSMLT